MMPPRLLTPVRSSFQRSRVRTRVVHYSTTTRLVRTTTRARQRAAFPERVRTRRPLAGGAPTPDIGCANREAMMPCKTPNSRHPIPANRHRFSGY